MAASKQTTRRRTAPTRPLRAAYTGPMTSRSGSIATGGAAQVAAPASINRRYLLIQNKTASPESFWVTFGGTAVADSPSIEFPPGLTLTWEGGFIPTDAISVIAPTTGTKFTIQEG